MSDLTPSPFGREVKRLRADRGWSQDELAERSGLTQGAITHLESGRRGAVPETVVALARAFGRPVSSFFPLLPPPVAEAIGAAASIPLLGPVAAGPGVELEAADPGETVSLSGLVALVVRGHSMEGSNVHDGDRIIVRLGPVKENGVLVVAQVDGGYTFKRLVRRNSRWWLDPWTDDDGIKPIACDRHEEVRIVGKVTGVLWRG